jgi:hypothetical protein
MAELFLESPVSVGFFGVVLVLIAFFVWMNTGSKPALYGAVVLALLTILSVIFSINIRTDREQVEVVLTEVAQGVERNDLQRVLNYIHPNAVDGLLRAKSELPNYKFTEARITGVKSIIVDKRTTPRSAVAEFHVAVSLSGNGNQVNGVRRFVRCYFLHSDGRWLVHDYEHFEPTAGFRHNVP